MTVLLKEKRESLISDIMIATSQDEVAKLIQAVVKTLKQKDHNDEMLAMFVDAVSAELDSFNPHKETAQEWSNIKMARIVINRLKYHWDTVTY
jgi:spore coat polysaccharide biosynthesis predicted glycosyltransferase SpsG